MPIKKQPKRKRRSSPSRGNIRSRDAVAKAAFDFAPLNGCFGDSGIRPSDIDGMVEHRGQLLFLEHKSDGRPLPIGQKMAFNTLCHLGAQVVVFWSTGSDHDIVRISEHPLPPEPGTLEDLKLIVSEWFEWAHSQIRPW